MNPTLTNSWRKLQELFTNSQNIHLSDRFKPSNNRFEQFSIETDEVLFDFSKHHIDNEILETLMALSKEQNLDAEKAKYFGGEKINQTEDRAVLHTALRNVSNAPIHFEGVDVMPQVNEVLNKIDNFSKRVIEGEFKGFKGERITDVVNIGIGGSDLGPKMVVNGLRAHKNHLKLHYVSNIDYSAIEAVIASVNLETTLFVIVSKTFTTIETLTNAETAKKAVIDHFNDSNSVANHFVAVSTNVEKVTEFGIDQNNIFEFWDWVGGRYSLWSAVGLSIALAVGFDNFKQLLSGAHSADKHFKSTENSGNIPLIMALLDIWYNNFHNYRSLAVIPYAEDLSLFPKFLQQLDMESNGKSTDNQGNKIDYKTSNVIWGEAGTDSQHSFFQLLHQGTDIVPVDFIGVRKSGIRNEHDSILMSNLLAQSQAMMEGTFGIKSDDSDPLAVHKEFDGNRPSTTIILKELTPHNLGYLTALYEHKVFVQGVLWNVFSYDQWGVQLGKKLATQISNYSEEEIENLDSSTKSLYRFYN